MRIFLIFWLVWATLSITATGAWGDDDVHTVWLNDINQFDELRAMMGCRPPSPSLYLYDVSNAQILTQHQAAERLPEAAELLHGVSVDCDGAMAFEPLRDVVGVPLDATHEVIALLFDIPGDDQVARAFPPGVVNRRDNMLEAIAEMPAGASVRIRFPWTPGQP
jgi:hypothetical protein